MALTSAIPAHSSALRDLESPFGTLWPPPLPASSSSSYTAHLTPALPHPTSSTLLTLLTLSPNVTPRLIYSHSATLTLQTSDRIGNVPFLSWRAMLYHLPFFTHPPSFPPFLLLILADIGSDVGGISPPTDPLFPF